MRLMGKGAGCLVHDDYRKVDPASRKFPAKALVANYNNLDSPRQLCHNGAAEESAAASRGQCGAEGATAPETLRHKKPQPD